MKKTLFIFILSITGYYGQNCGCEQKFSISIDKKQAVKVAGQFLTVITTPKQAPAKQIVRPKPVLKPKPKPLTAEQKRSKISFVAATLFQLSKNIELPKRRHCEAPKITTPVRTTNSTPSNPVRPGHKPTGIIKPVAHPIRG